MSKSFRGNSRRLGEISEDRVRGSDDVVEHRAVGLGKSIPDHASGGCSAAHFLVENMCNSHTLIENTDMSSGQPEWEVSGKKPVFTVHIIESYSMQERSELSTS